MSVGFQGLVGIPSSVPSMMPALGPGGSGRRDAGEAVGMGPSTAGVVVRTGENR
jgi:hypothetical protein